MNNKKFLMVRWGDVFGAEIHFSSKITCRRILTETQGVCVGGVLGAELFTYFSLSKQGANFDRKN